MNILLSNDDGYKAEGINYLKDYFTDRGHSVFVVAPDREKSGSSQSITFRDSIRLVEQKDNLWVLKSTPADCVTLALLGLVPEKIDVVVSGINHGPNIGRDIFYSGTVGCARQASFVGIPSFALSINSWKSPYHFEVAGDFLDKNFERLLSKGNGDFFYNINFPNFPPEEIEGIQKTTPCKKHYFQDELLYFDAPLQGRYYWVKGTSPIYELEKNTDAFALKNKFISVSLLRIFPEISNVDIDFE